MIADVHDAAMRVVEETRTIRPSAADRRIFAAALLDPRAPSSGLESAARGYLKLIGA